MKHIAVFASGSGTNAEKIFEKFQQHPKARVILLLTNNPQAGVIERAARFDIPVKVFDKTILSQTDEVLQWLQEARIDWIVLAGFLLKVPGNIIQAFAHRILNIHPALLPAHGGKGMYGIYVHRAVVAAKEPVTGITIHEVNENYDEGKVILQASCLVAPEDTPEAVAAKVQQLEHRYYPKVIEEFIEAGS